MSATLAAPEFAVVLLALGFGAQVGTDDFQSEFKIVDKAVALIEREGGIRPFLQNVGFGGIFLALVVNIIDGINDFGTILFGLPAALGLGMIDLINAFFDGLGDVFGAGTETAVRSLSSGVASLLGPFAQPFSVGVIMLSFAVFILAINRLNISPLSFIQNVRG